MLPCNGPTIRGVTSWSGDDSEDVIDDHIQITTGSSRNTMTRRGRERSRFLNAPSRQGQGKFVDLTEARSESGNVSTDSDRPLAYHPQGVRTRIDAEGKATEEPPRNYKQAHSSTKTTTAATTSSIGNTALNNTSLPDDHEPKYLPQARRDYTVMRPPFVRLNRNKGVLGPKRVIFATPDGQVPQREIPANLAIRAWDAISSFYTLDINGERLIVKPVGGRFNHANRGVTQYRAWSGQGNTYESTPVAFELKGDVED